MLRTVNDAFGAWFDAFGVPPVLGAFVFGLLLAYAVLPRRGERAPATPVVVRRTAGGPSVELGERKIDIPAEVALRAASGDKIAAIKALRHAAGLQLIDAKRIVDALAR